MYPSQENIAALVIEIFQHEKLYNWLLATTTKILLFSERQDLTIDPYEIRRKFHIIFFHFRLTISLDFIYNLLTEISNVTTFRILK